MYIAIDPVGVAVTMRASQIAVVGEPEADRKAALAAARTLYFASTHLSDPTSFTATFENETFKGLPSAVP